MKKTFLILGSVGLIAFASCGEKHESSDQVIETKDMYSSEADGGGAGMSPADSSADSSAKPYVPGSDNPRKVDMAGTPHPNDTLHDSKTK